MIISFTCFYHLCKKSYAGVLVKIITVLLIVSGFSFIARGQENKSYDEVAVMLNMQQVGSTEISAVIVKQDAYLSVKDVFDFLKIKNMPSAAFDSISGFFINPKATFLIDKNHISYLDKKFDLTPNDVFVIEPNLYLKAAYFGQVFGLECSFNFRSLTVQVDTKAELPIIREMQQELLRKNIVLLKGQAKADSTIARKSFSTGFGIADWSVMSSRQSTGQSQTRLDLALGGLVAGGEAKVLLNYNNNLPFNPPQQFYSWRYVNNSGSIAKQFVAGRLLTQSTSTLLAPVVGVQFTNAPTTYRKSFGTYRLNSTTEPDWTVELYVNNVLVNYTKADASGFFTFDVPIVYGNSIVKLKFYGPWGEERVREEIMSIPFNFLPANQMEYTHTTGVVEDDNKAVFSRTAVNYGLSNHVTIGGGFEYLSSLANAKTMPFLNASVRIASNILMTGNYTHGVKASGILSYRLPSNFQLDLEYSKYDKEQRAILYSYTMERKLSVSMPFRGKQFSAFSKLSVNQLSYFKGQNTTSEFVLTTVMPGVTTNFTTYAFMQGTSIGYAYSNLSLGFRLPSAIKVQPQLRYEYNQKKISTVRIDVEKNLFNRGFFNLSFENNFSSHFSTVNIGFRYDLSFVQTLFSIQKNKQSTTTVQSARGSLWVDKNSKGLGVSNRGHVGKGGLLVIPFLDINDNNIFDKGEPRVYGLQLQVNGGIQEQNPDTTIRITGLEAYTNYRLEFDKSSFDNIAWMLSKQSIDVEIQPNYITAVNVPVRVAGEVAGTIYLKKNDIKNGQGRIIVVISDSNAYVVAKVLSEQDGYFSYLGLKPGSYTASIDKEQLQKINLTSLINSLPFNIVRNKDGDVVDGLELVVQPLSNTDSTTRNEQLEIIQKQLPEFPKHDGHIIETKQAAIVEKDSQLLKQKKLQLYMPKKTNRELENNQNEVTNRQKSSEDKWHGAVFKKSKGLKS